MVDSNIAMSTLPTTRTKEQAIAEGEEPQYAIDEQGNIVGPIYHRVPFAHDYPLVKMLPITNGSNSSNAQIAILQSAL